MTAHQQTPETPGPTEPDLDTEARLAECDAKLEKYRAALEAGVDPETVGAWITAVKADRAAITAQASAARTTADPTRKLTEE